MILNTLHKGDKYNNNNNNNLYIIGAVRAVNNIGVVAAPETLVIDIHVIWLQTVEHAQTSANLEPLGSRGTEPFLQRNTD
jgi:hypothetical protein